MLDRLQRSLDPEIPPAEIGDFGFWNDFETVLECAYLLTEYHILPGAGGWLDQDEELTEDLFTLLRIRARLRWEHDKQRGGGDLLHIVKGATRAGAADWRALLGD